MRGPRPHHRERSLRRQQTEVERALWQRVRDRRLLGRKFRRQHRIGRFVADFVCLDAGLIVELDGGQHLDRGAHDAACTRWLEAQGFRVIRFWNDDVLLRMDDVLTAIATALAAPHPLCGHPLPVRWEREKQTSGATHALRYRCSFSPPAGRRWPKAG